MTTIETSGQIDFALHDHASEALSRARKRIEWTLPGHGETRETCGTPGVRGHDADRIWHWQRYRHRCMRAACPECYEAWAYREGSAVKHRIAVGMPYGRHAVHVVLSPPQDVGVSTVGEYQSLRRQAYQVASRCGVRGGCLLFHHLRIPGRWNQRDMCVDGPHFHALVDGWIVDTKKEYARSGWVVVNLRVRRSVADTAAYLLSHASLGYAPSAQSIDDRLVVQTVTWFGSMAYNKLKVPEIEPEGRFCKLCDELIPECEWEDIIWEGSGPPPDCESGMSPWSDWRGIRAQADMSRGTWPWHGGMV